MLYSGVRSYARNMSAEEETEPDWVVTKPSPEFMEALRKGVGEAIRTAGPDYGQALRDLDKAVQQVSVVDLICVISLYFLTVKPGVNPEFDRPGGIFQHHVELIQAFALRRKLEETKPEIPLQDGLKAVAEGATAVTDAFMILEAARIARAGSEEDRRRRIAVATLRLHRAVVRGSAYHSIMAPMIAQLYAPLDDQLDRSIGLNPSALVAFWWAVAAEIEDRIESHRDRVREVAELPLNEEWRNKVKEVYRRIPVELNEDLMSLLSRNDEQRRAFAIIAGDANLLEVFGFSLEQLVSLYPGDVRPEDLQRILDLWSLEFGGTGEISLDEVLLENPVSSRPIVKLTDRLFLWPLASAFHHSAIGMLETTFEDRTDLWAEYLDRRGKYLERAVSSALSAKFTDATALVNFKWVHPDDGKEYETDLLILVGSSALIVESKGGRISKHSYMGKGRPLRDDIHELIVEPSVQAHRLGTLIEANNEVEITTEAGESAVIDTSDVLEIITLGTTLESIAAMLPDLREVVDAGLTTQEVTALSHSIALSDLQVVLEILEHPSEVLHYFRRRGEIENGTFLEGDEVDLLGFYLESGFNLGESEFTEEHQLQTFGLSDPIDTYYYGLEAGLTTDKPTSKRTEWWEALLTAVERKALPYWTEIGHVICNVAYEQQVEFRNSLEQLKVEIESGERTLDDFVLFQNGPEQRRDFLIGLVATEESSEARAIQIQNAASQVFRERPDVDRLLVISLPMTSAASPYRVLALVLRPSE